MLSTLKIFLEHTVAKVTKKVSGKTLNLNDQTVNNSEKKTWN